MRYVESLNNALHTLMEEDERVYVLGEDILDPYGGAFKVTKGLSTKFPERVLTTPISEAAITGISTGMALRGLLPVVEIMFGDFIALCADQIVNNAAKFHGMYNGQVEVPIVVRTPMGGGRGYGPTHSQSLESLFLGVPNLKIVAPSHLHNPGRLLRTAVLMEKQPVLFIENKLLYPRMLEQHTGGRGGEFFSEFITHHNPEYPSVRMKLARKDKADVTLVTYGGMAVSALEAALQLFIEEEIIVDVIIPSLIKPFPIPDIIPSLTDSRRLVIAEEGVVTAGWGAALSSLLYEKTFDILRKAVTRVGSREMTIPSAKHLEAQVLPQVSDIVAAIIHQCKD